MESVNNSQDAYSTDYANVSVEDYNALLASICFDATFKAHPDEGNLTIIYRKGAEITRTKSSGDVTIRGIYEDVASCEEIIEDSIPQYEGYIGGGSVKSLFLPAQQKEAEMTPQYHHPAFKTYMGRFGHSGK